MTPRIRRAAATLGLTGAALLSPVLLPAPTEAAAPLEYDLDRAVIADDPAGGRIAEAVGDLRGAEHVAIVVPGSGQDRSTFRADPESPGTVPLDNARDLYTAMRAHSPDVAVIAWLGYRPPSHPGPYALRPDAARAGAGDLARLSALLPAGVHTTLVCHSYGAATCGAAARSPGTADDLVSLAGIGLDAGSAADLHTRVWATRTADDWTRNVPGFSVGALGLGTDPVQPGFGARTFTDSGISGHGEYYTPGSATLASTAAIAVRGGGAQLPDR
ncbi:alpha/beta hydrolase [Nocardiopsis coralliicola]